MLNTQLLEPFGRKNWLLLHQTVNGRDVSGDASDQERSGGKCLDRIKVRVSA